MSDVPSPRSRTRRRTPRLATAPAAAGLCLGLTLALAACSSEDPEATSGSASETPAVTPTPSESAGSESPSASAGDQAVPVYFAGDAAGGTRLFREFQRVSGDALTEAALLVDGGSPLDPDYLTLWPGGAVERAAVEGDTITVTLNADAFTTAPDGMEAEDATLALQQMVHTLQGTAQKRLPVRFVRTTGPATLFGIDVSKPVKRADWMETLATMNVTTPAQGATVTGDTLTAEGVGSSFEATVLWEVRRGDEVVLSGSTTAEGWDKLYPWKAEVDLSELEPGEYTFSALTDDPSGGTEGPGPTEDTKDFTLK